MVFLGGNVKFSTVSNMFYGTFGSLFQIESAESLLFMEFLDNTIWVGF